MVVQLMFGNIEHEDRCSIGPSAVRCSDETFPLRRCGPPQELVGTLQPFRQCRGLQFRISDQLFCDLFSNEMNSGQPNGNRPKNSSPQLAKVVLGQ